VQETNVVIVVGLTQFPRMQAASVRHAVQHTVVDGTGQRPN